MQTLKKKNTCVNYLFQLSATCLMSAVCGRYPIHKYQTGLCLFHSNPNKEPPVWIFYRLIFSTDLEMHDSRVSCPSLERGR